MTGTKLKQEEGLLSQNDLLVSDKELLKAYYSIFMHAAEAIMIIKDGLILDCNVVFERLLNRSRLEVIGHRPSDFSPEFQPDGDLSSFKSNLYVSQAQEGKSQVFEWVFNSPKGGVIFVEASLNSFTIRDNHFVSAFLRDITDLKKKNTELEHYQKDLENIVKEKTESLESLNKELSVTVKELLETNIELNKTNEELSRIIKDYGREKRVSKELQNLLLSSQIKLKSFISQSADGIVIVDSDSQIIEWNQKMVEITGIEYENAVYKKIFDIKFKVLPKIISSDKQVTSIKEAIIRYLSNSKRGEIKIMEAELESINSENKFVSITVFPIKIQNTNLFGCIVKDITLKKKQEKEIEYYQKHLEELVAYKTKEVSELSNQFNELFNNASDCIFFIRKSSNGKFQYTKINHQGLKALNVDEKDISFPVDLESVIQTKNHNKFKANLSRCLNSGIPINFEESLSSDNGETIWNTTLIPYKRANKSYTRLVGFSRNITSTKQAQEAMELVDELYKSSQSLIIVFNREGKVVNFNEECSRLSGYNFNNFRGVEFWNYPVTQEEDRVPFKNLFERAVNGEINNFDLYANWKTRDDRLIWIYWKNTCLFDSNGNFKYLITTGLNITEKKLFESALIASERKFRNIFDSSEDGIAIISRQMSLVQANPSLQRMLESDEVHIFEGTIFDSIPPNFTEIVNQATDDIFKQKAISNLEIELVKRNGQKFPVELSARLIEYEGNPSILVIIRDITDRKEMEKVILHTIIDTEERERRRLAGDLHDEIGPLLASLRMYVSILQQKLKDTNHSEVLGIMMNLIKNSVENIRTISNNISPHLIERYGLASAINAEVDNVRLLLPILFQTNTTGLKFSRNVELIFYRIIKELINNTIKYANAKNVSIKLFYSESILSLEYSDDGIGFDPDEIEKEKNKGLGLFNIVNRIKSINGDYSYATSPGKGFKFTLSSKTDFR